jgi:hypothetical protein
MISVRIEGLDATLARLQGQAKQVKFAAAVALTKTAQDVRAELARDMAAKLPGASPYSLKSQFVAAAKRDNLQATVGIKDKKPARGTAPAMLLKEHFAGGLRGNKPMEKAMSALSALPDGWIAVPGAGLKLDRYGNPNRKQVDEVLGALRSGMAVHGGRGKRAYTSAYFVAQPDAPRARHLAPGIYRRTNNRAITPVFLFVQRAAYRKVIDLPGMGKRIVASRFNAHFAAALQNALATAR